MAFQKLCLLLQKQAELLEKMLVAAQRQNFALRRNNLAALDETTRELAVLVGEMDHQEAARQEAQRQLETQRNIPSAATFKELLAFLPPTEARALTALEQLMSGRSEKLAQLIKTNELLTRNALAFNAKLLQAFTPAVAVAAPAPGKTYLADGSVEMGGKSLSLIDQSI